MLILTYLLNILDYIFTLYWVRKFGIEIEGNPIGRWVFSHNIAWAVKFLAVGGLLALLGYFIKSNPQTAWTAYIMLAVYAAVCIYHIVIAICIAKIKM